MGRELSPAEARGLMLLKITQVTAATGVRKDYNTLILR